MRYSIKPNVVIVNKLTSRMLKEVFEVDAEIRQGPQGRPWVFCQSPYQSPGREGGVYPGAVPPRSAQLSQTSTEPSPPRS